MKNKFTETRSEEKNFWEDSNNILNILEQFNEEIKKILK